MPICPRACKLANFWTRVTKPGRKGERRAGPASVRCRGVSAGSQRGKSGRTSDEATEGGGTGRDRVGGDSLRKATVAAAAAATAAAIFCRTSGRVRHGRRGHSTYGSWVNAWRSRAAVGVRGWWGTGGGGGGKNGGGCGGWGWRGRGSRRRVAGGGEAGSYALLISSEMECRRQSVIHWLCWVSSYSEFRFNHRISKPDLWTVKLGLIEALRSSSLPSDATGLPRQ